MEANMEMISYGFAIARMFGIVIFLALLVLLAVVLIKAKRKRREKMKEQLHELFNVPDDGSKK